MSDLAAPGMKPWSIWWHAARPKTLWAAVAPVIVGTALAYEAGAFHALAAACALLGAILIQIGVNFHNDYSDFLKGADTEERIGPLRVTQAGLVSPETMKRATIGVFVAAVLSGLFLIYRGGWPILAVGVSSILFAYLYTGGKYSLAYLGVADLAVLVFFGPVAVGGTFYVQALGLPLYAILAGLGPGFLATAILLVNNIRDVESDRAAGKKTLVVRLGRMAGIGLYIFCLVAAAAVPVALWLLTGGHLWALAASAAPLLGIPVVRHLATRYGRELNAELGATARILIIYSLLFSAGWML